MSSSTAPGEVWGQAGARRELTRLALAIGALLLVQFAAHRAAVAGGGAGIAALAPLLLPGGIAVLVGFRRGAVPGLAVLAMLAGLSAAAMRAPAAAQLLPLIAQLALCLALAWLFGHTLAPGAVPLVTQMARAVHGALPAPIEAYTRRVTVAWTLFMLLLCAGSLLLFVYAPLPVWSVFANLLLLPLVGLMFLGEYAYRVLRYRWYAHATLAQSVTAFQRLRAARSADR
jgi:uncharacterized membrane protein